jgi:DNA-binding MarR family transcriptional regulator
MAIERDLRKRMDLELAGYRSAQHLSNYAAWLFQDDNMARALAQGYFKRVNNGRWKISYYYQLTAVGRAVLRRAGSGFTYGDAKGRELVGSKRLRWVKVSLKQRRQKAAQLLGAFQGLVTDKATHGRLSLEKQGWMPSKTITPPSGLLEAGLVEQRKCFHQRNSTYFRLTVKGRKVLASLRRRPLLLELLKVGEVLK